MQCRYFGDVGDFGKYGLLRALCSPTTFKLGVAWYLVPNETHNNDGKHISYLCESCNVHAAGRLKECDADLYSKLQELISISECQGSMHECSGVRCVRRIREKKLLPKAVFFEEPLSFQGIPGRNRVAYRNNWIKRALAQLKECNVIFIDPDNGINLNNHATKKKGPKYTFFDELNRFIGEEKRSLIVYHHSNFSEKVDNQIKTLLTLIRQKLNCSHPFALRYHRGTSRSFFIIPGTEMAAETFSQKAIDFERNWGEAKWGADKHFTLYKDDKP